MNNYIFGIAREHCRLLAINCHNYFLVASLFLETNLSNKTRHKSEIGWHRLKHPLYRMASAQASSLQDGIG